MTKRHGVPREPISIKQSQWQTTFPHIVQPRVDEDESLPGLLLRCDEVNDWPCGTAVGFTSVGHLPHDITSMALLVPYFLVFDALATALAISSDEVEATTYTREIKQLLSLPNEEPIPHQLGKSPPFRVCPLCMADGHLLRRTIALQGLSHCAIHQVRLREGVPAVPDCRPFLRVRSGT